MTNHLSYDTANIHPKYLKLAQINFEQALVFFYKWHNTYDINIVLKTDETT